MKNFAEILAPISTDEFFNDYYRKKPLYIKGSPAKIEGLLDWQRFNHLLSLNNYWTPDRLTLWYNCAKCAEGRYCKLIKTHDGDRMIPDLAIVNSLLASGATVVADEIDSLTPELSAVANALEEALWGQAFANTYCSFKGVKAFDVHYDDHEVFAIHTEGSKRWRVFEERVHNPIGRAKLDPNARIAQNRNRSDVLLDIGMEPGDILYLPRGQYHDALACDGPSLHVTFSVFPMRGLDMLPFIEQIASSKSLFWDDLPSGRNDSDRRKLSERLERLSATIGEIMTAPEFLEHLILKQRQRRTRRAALTIPDFEEPEYFQITSNNLNVGLRGMKGFLLGGEQSVPLPIYGIEPTNWILKNVEFSRQELEAQFSSVESGHIRELIELLLTEGVIVKKGAA